VAEYSKARLLAAVPGLEAELSNSDYIVGPKFSGVDVMLAGAVRGIMVRLLHIICIIVHCMKRACDCSSHTRHQFSGPNQNVMLLG
jgi:glutathione S-transferase